jgi:AraC family transcriptional regulator
MTPRIKILSGKKLIGKSIQTSLANNKTPELWRSFMPRRSEIQNPISSDLFAIQVYEPNYFETFNPNTVF